jgi:hypothetical protein
MGNHVHLLIEEGETDLSLIIKKLALSYSHRFNAKYDRSGYLFQGRYRREAVTGNEHLLVVVRYIHNNPVRIGEPRTLWTSYDEYVKSPRIVDTGLVLGLFDGDLDSSRRQFAQFSELESEPDETVLDESGSKKIKDADAVELIKEIANIPSCQDLMDAEKDERDWILALLKKKGLSVRQIARLTGISRNIVQRAGMSQLPE